MALTVPRRFYVNMREPDPSKQHKRVTRVLPRSHPCLHLYEFNMTETEYQLRQRELTAKLSHTDIEGVYELQLPLLWRALIALGCMAQVQPEVRS
jgi:DNA polymerase epsilon subunit 1